jgi:hypothetical protein
MGLSNRNLNGYGEMPVKPTKQTSFRADRALLNEFQSALALVGREMSPVIEGWIRAYMSTKGDESRTLSIVREGLLASATKDERERLEDYLLLMREAEERGEKAVEIVRLSITKLRELIGDWPKMRV